MIDVVAHATELKESYTYADYLFWDTEERYEIEIVFERDLRERSFVGDEIVDLLGIVEDHHNYDYQRDGKKVSPEELTDYVSVEDL